MKSLHDNIGYVSQEHSLFTDTIENNISLSLDKQCINRINNATQMSNCQFIFDKRFFPDGYKTNVNTNNLSGGQKQRIAIARAIIKNSQILIFDEATSALDSSSEFEVQNAIEGIIKQGNITTIIIAHKLSTIKNCNKIIVMKNGEIVQQGNHKELIKLEGEYKFLFEKQLEIVSN